MFRMDDDGKLCTEIYDKLRKRPCDEYTWALFYSTYYHYIFTIVKNCVFNNNLYDDIVSAVFEKIYRFIEKYNPDLPIKPWLAIITKRTCFDISKHYQSKNEILKDSTQDLFNSKEKTEENPYDTLALKDALKQACGKVSNKQKVIVYKFKKLDGYSYKEIASIFNMPEKSLHNWVFEVNNIVKDYLSKKYLNKN